MINNCCSRQKPITLTGGDVSQLQTGDSSPFLLAMSWSRLSSICSHTAGDAATHCWRCFDHESDKPFGYCHLIEWYHIKGNIVSAIIGTDRACILPLVEKVRSANPTKLDCAAAPSIGSHLNRSMNLIWWCELGFRSCCWLKSSSQEIFK